MFKYVSFKSPEISQLFSLLCTSVIASNEGFSADLETTEVVPRPGGIALFYRIYYSLIAGVYSSAKKTTVNAMTFATYESTYYNIVERTYNTQQKEADAFLKLSESQKFSLVFNNALLPTVIQTSIEELVSAGTARVEAENLAKSFKKDFIKRYVSKVDELTILNTTDSDLWISLYDMAVEMPHVVIGLRKQISAYNSTFFRENKNNLESVTDFVKAQKLKNTDYTDALSIAGVIIGAFKNYFIKPWIGNFGWQLSAGSATFQDDEGDIQSASELQDKMYTTSGVTQIKDFENLMIDIDKGGLLFDVVNDRYFNLIKWRQNIILDELLKGLNNSGLCKMLACLGIELGGTLTIHDIAHTLDGSPNSGRTEKMLNVDNFLREVYNTPNLDSTVANHLIDKEIKKWKDRKDDGDESAKDGKATINFSYKKQNLYTANKARLRSVIRGIQALKVLEARVKEMDYSFMSFPSYSRNPGTEPYELLTHVGLSDYLNQVRTEDEDEVIIESDINASEDLEGLVITDNVRSRADELMNIVNRNVLSEKISFFELNDEDLTIEVTKSSDLDMLSILRHKGVKLKINKGAKYNSVRDLVFSNVKNSLNTTRQKFFIAPDTFTKNWVDVLKGQENNVRVDTSWLACGFYRHLTEVIHRYALYGNLTKGISANADAYAERMQADPEGNVVCVLGAEIGEGDEDYTLEELTAARGCEITQEDKKRMSDDLYCWIELQGRISGASLNSKDGESNTLIFESHFDKVPIPFMNKDRTGGGPYFDLIKLFVPFNNDGSHKSLDVVDEICKKVTSRANYAAGTELNPECKYYLPRAISLLLNIHTVLEYIIAAFTGLRDYIYGKVEFVKAGSGVVDISLLLFSLKAITNINTKLNGLNSQNVLKAYESVYQDLFDAVDFDTNNFKKNSRKDYRTFTFMEHIGRVDRSFNITDERVFQYREVTKVINLILTNRKAANIEFGGVDYSLIGFVSLIEELLTIDKRNQDKEFYVDSVAIATLEENVQRNIGARLTEYIESHKVADDFDESDPWFENVYKYCAQRNMVISQNVKSNIKLNSDKYTINQYNLVTYNNKVLYTIQYKNDRNYTVVATRFGIFEYDGIGLREYRGQEGRCDFEWLLH